MSNEQAKRETMSIDEATVSNMREIAAIIELQEQKRLCTKRYPHTIIDELRRKNPHAHEFLRRSPLSRTSSRKPRKRLSTTA
jgi:hypothetical protein